MTQKMTRATAIREFVKASEMRVEKEFPAAVDRAVEALLAAAMERAAGNGRKTLKECDL